MSEWRNEIVRVRTSVLLRAHQPSPLPTWTQTRGPRLVGNIASCRADWSATNPLALSLCPLSLLGGNPSRTSIIVSYDCFLPRHPFTEPPSSRARDRGRRIMARNRFADLEETGLTRRDWSARFLIIISIRRATFQGDLQRSAYVASARAHSGTDSSYVIGKGFLGMRFLHMSVNWSQATIAANVYWAWQCRA
jgi:hypothetical protein